MTAISKTTIVAAPGGSFLIEPRTASEVFTPEDLREEQRQIAASADRFAVEEILPRAKRIEAREAGAMASMLRRAGELGFIGAEIPEEYGGMGLEKVSSAVITDRLAVLASFSTAFGAQAGIGCLPLVWYGTGEQKRRYLPRLASGEWIAAYALSESGSGSDAMGIRTGATLSADGSEYILAGEKMWITNGGIADLFTVFAKVGGDHFSAFLVERTAPGLTVGTEEHKMGIRGSSTCPLVLDGCRIPVGNLLGEVGKGHHIAFNVLNAGRLKLGMACIGGARQALGEMIAYAKQRVAFGRPIAEFGLVRKKIAASAARLYAAESMAYRTAGMIDASLAGICEDEKGQPAETQRRIEEYAVECSIVKVYGSEMLSTVADELVATMGGYGYVEEYPAERTYRDARINRIFEGTNEINRLLITGRLMKRAAKGQLPLLGAIKKVMDEVTAPPSFGSGADEDRLLAREAGALTAAKKLTLFAAGVASQRFMTTLEEQQEIMAELADMIAQVYALESALLRARKLTEAGKSSAAPAVAMTGLVAEETVTLAEQAARRVVAACAEGDMLRTQLAIVRRVAKYTPADSVGLSRAVAEHCVRAGKYPI